MLPARYDYCLVTLSVCISIFAAYAAFGLAQRVTATKGRRKALWIAGGVLLGLTFSAVHYMGMVAAYWRFNRTPNFSGAPNISWIGGVAIAVGTLLLLGIAIAASETERRFSAQSRRLSSSEERYRTLFNRSVAAIYISNLDGIIVDMNQACMDLLGYKSREEVVGKKVRTVHLPEEALKTYLELLTTTRQFPAREMRLFRADGSVVWVMLSATLLEFQDGSPAQIQGMLLSIDELKHSEDKLRLAKYSAESANLAKTQFLANMSHELRTPLNGVLGMTQLLTDTTLSEQQKDYVEVTRTSAESLLALINHILEFSTSEAGQAAASSEEFDIRKLLREEVSWAAPLAVEKQLKLRAEVSPETAEKFWGEPRWIRQIFSALLSNALRFTLRGEIVVAISTRGHAGGYQLITLSVSDTGLGIPPEKQKLIFEPFTQADDSNTRSFGGTGLGLSIVQNLVKAMGGQISLESQPGRGSVFSIVVPLLTQPGTLPSANAIPQTRSASEPALVA